MILHIITRGNTVSMDRNCHQWGNGFDHLFLQWSKRNLAREFRARLGFALLYAPIEDGQSK